ncbi:MAG TPA: FAD-binding oxidoreductase [Steroidobacteraceae bacterium]|nr:FAD-binding oxidoreductase [Steroidobacteraceae bacterium]
MLLTPSHVAELRMSLCGKLLLPGEGGYDIARKLWNGAFDHKPALIARCVNAEDVARAVEFAHASGVVLSVRGGGHSFSGQSGCDGGLMIDLSEMRDLRVDQAARKAHVSAGALLGEIDRAAQAVSLVTSTGTVSHTGAAGLTLGGGFGRLARKFGLTCDNLAAAELVTADGKRIRASAHENPELLWGLRGGGGNFGVVTSFEYQLYPMPRNMIGGVLVFPFNEPRKLLRSFADFAATASDDFFAMVDIVPTPEGHRVIAIEVCHCGSRAEAERELTALRKIGTAVQDSLGSAPYTELQTRIDKDYPAGRGYYLKSGLIQEISNGLIDRVVDHLEAAPAPRCLASFIQLGGAISRVNQSATAYWHRSAGHSVLLAGFWDQPSDADTPRLWVKTGWKHLEPLTDGFYVNLMAEDDDEQRIRNTYGANYERLAALKRKYDPANLFRRNANVRPAEG